MNNQKQLRTGEEEVSKFRTFLKKEFLDTLYLVEFPIGEADILANNFVVVVVVVVKSDRF